MKRKLQVFISSTFTDLISERQAAVQALLKSGHIPAGMELFTAGDKSQMQTIERWIDESDVYMLILGGRYGSIEPTTKLSYTELEYDYAVASQKPLFAMVMNEAALELKVRQGGTQFIEKDNQAALKLFREKVLSRSSSFFDDTKDVKLCVHESISDLATNPELKGWVSATEIIDSKTMSDEIARLRAENVELIGKIEELRLRESKIQDDGKHIAELSEILRSIELDIPAKLASGKEVKMNLLDLSYGNKDTLIIGVSNSARSSDAEIFFYYNVLPKLQSHGLADNEKVPGAQYRRSFLNKAGQKFFAQIEKDLIKTKEQNKLSPVKKKRSPKKPPTPVVGSEG
jgi:hypothetical protein